MLLRLSLIVSHWASLTTIGECEPTVWTRFAGVNIYDGQPRATVTTLSSCQSACVANSSCTAIDWDSSATTMCWFHGPWSAGNQMNSYPTADHYQLTRNICYGECHFCSLWIHVLGVYYNQTRYSLFQGWAKCGPRAACGPRIPFVRSADSSKKRFNVRPFKKS